MDEHLLAAVAAQADGVLVVLGAVGDDAVAGGHDYVGGGADDHAVAQDQVGEVLVLGLGHGQDLAGHRSLQLQLLGRGLLGGFGGGLRRRCRGHLLHKRLGRRRVRQLLAATMFSTPPRQKRDREGRSGEWALPRTHINLVQLRPHALVGLDEGVQDLAGLLGVAHQAAEGEGFQGLLVGVLKERIYQQLLHGHLVDQQAQMELGDVAHAQGTGAVGAQLAGHLDHGVVLHRGNSSRRRTKDFRNPRV